MHKKNANTLIAGEAPNLQLERGCVAGGYAGLWSAEADQTISGAERWFLHLRGPALMIYLELPSIDVIAKAATMFGLRSGVAKGRSPHSESLELGELSGVSVALIFDDELRDRCFVSASQYPSTIRYGIAGSDFADLAAAISRLKDALVGDGWLPATAA